jgi:curved DNA-binding protein
LKPNAFVDHYESLQVSPNADQETIERVFRFLAKRYHPDNGAKGDVERFSLLVEAHNVLSDPEKRAAYDAAYDNVRAVQSRIREESAAVADQGGDEEIRHGILSTLYIDRRRSAQDSGLGSVHLEQVLECPQFQMDFHLWYLREKGWVERTDTGMYAITVAGVDEVEKKRLTLKKELLLTGPRDIKPSDL